MIALNSKVLIISTTETFTVRGLATKLKSVGAESAYAPPRVNDIGPKVEDCQLIILYTDEKMAEAVDVLVYIKDCCAEKNKMVMVIGSTDEYNTVSKNLPEKCLYKFFERPLDMEKFLDAVEEYYSDVTKRSRRKNILIVDDDVTYMSMIMDWLKDSYRVSMANSGMQAITWLANNEPDLILLDYEMPVTTGPQVLEMIRSDVKTADIPVMFLTGKGDKASIMKVLAFKPAGYLLKSIDRKGLHENLENFFATQTAKGK